MIRIKKLPKPPILQKNDIIWTQEYLKALNNEVELTDTIKNRYNQEEIKNNLIKETHGKCAYCESKINHISFADIEHIIPKSKKPELYVDWNNLTLSCEICNRTNKKDYYDPSDPIINPIQEEPSDYLIAYGNLILHKPGNRKGELTIKILDLNRPALLERRVEKLNNFTIMVDKYMTESNIEYKKILKEQLVEEASSNSEYSFILWSYLKFMKII